MKFFIVIFGATGVGKTDFVDRLISENMNFKNLNFEIINADMGQMYMPLSVGTAKPDLSKSIVKQHLFDILKDPQDYTVEKYRSNLEVICNDLWDNNKIPIIVGGSGFYIKSIFFPLSKSVKQFKDSSLLSSIISKNNDQNWNTLNLIDPDRAESIHPNDQFRIVRALQIWHETGVLPSKQAPCYKPLSSNFLLINLTRNRDELYNRIDSRVISMIDSGWEDEVLNLSLEWKEFIKIKKIIGYDDVLKEKINNNTIKTIQKKTRNYAKRQMTFWNSLKRDILLSNSSVNIKDINLTLDNALEYIKQIREFYE